MLTESGIKIISADPGTVGEQILHEIAHPKEQPLHHPRSVEAYYRNGDRGCSVATSMGEKLRFLLTTNKKEGLFIRQVEGSTFSLLSEKKILEVGKNLPICRIRGIANQLVAEYVIGCKKSAYGAGFGSAKKSRFDRVLKREHLTL